MKKRSLIQFPVVVGMFIIAGIIFVACSKQRITQDTFSPMDSFYNNNQQQEQEFPVDSPGTPPCIIKGTMGTILANLCNDAMFVRKSNGTNIYYPYKIRLTEVYSVKDIILSRVPTIAGGTILESEAVLRVRAFKDADELNLKTGQYYGIAVAPLNPMMSNPEEFWGLQPTGLIDWALAGDALCKVIPDTSGGLFNSFVVGKLDWVQSAKPHASSASTTTLTIKAIGNNTQNIDIYIVFKNFKSVMKVTNLVSGQIPIGENVTLIAMALNQNNDYLLDKEDITITAGQTITLNFTTVSESSLLSTLSGL